MASGNLPARLAPRLGRPVCAAALCGWLVLCGVRAGQSAPLDPNERAARQEAIEAIPFAELTSASKAKIWPVVSNPSIFRRLPTKSIRCDADLHLFLIRHPEVVVNIWELMGITKVSVRRTSDFTFHASDGMGTESDVQLVYGTPDKHILFADASYDGPLLPKPIKCKCVMVLRSHYGRTPDDDSAVTNRLDVFVLVENAGVDLLARTLQPLIGNTADHNFTETLGFVARLSQTAQNNGPGMQRLAARLDKIDPTVRDQFVELTGVISRDAQLRQARPPASSTVVQSGAIELDPAAAPPSGAPITSPHSGAWLPVPTQAEIVVQESAPGQWQPRRPDSMRR